VGDRSCTTTPSRDGARPAGRATTMKCSSGKGPRAAAARVARPRLSSLEDSYDGEGRLLAMRPLGESVSAGREVDLTDLG
jgi:hypothetical protein